MRQSLATQQFPATRVYQFPPAKATPSLPPAKGGKGNEIAKGTDSPKLIAPPPGKANSTNSTKPQPPAAKGSGGATALVADASSKEPKGAVRVLNVELRGNDWQSRRNLDGMGSRFKGWKMFELGSNGFYSFSPWLW